MWGDEPRGRPEGRGRRLRLPAVRVRDQKRAEKKYILHKGRARPSAGQSCELEEGSVRKQSRRNNKLQPCRRVGSCSARCARTYCEENRSGTSGGDSPNRRRNRAKE